MFWDTVFESRLSVELTTDHKPFRLSEACSGMHTCALGRLTFIPLLVKSSLVDKQGFSGCSDGQQIQAVSQQIQSVSIQPVVVETALFRSERYV